MKFKWLVLKNYGSFFGKHTFQFDKGLLGVFGTNHDEPRMGSNGSGKSTIFDALDWCLFGEVPRKDTADSVINEEKGKGCEVDVMIVDDGGNPCARIVRYRKTSAGSGVRFWCNGVEDANEITKLDAKQTQKLINEFLGMDRKVFHAAVLFAQKRDFDFADATDAERKRILTRILQLEDIDAWLAQAKAEHTKLEATIQKNGHDYNNLFGEWDKQKAVNPQAVIDQWALDRNHRLANLAKEIDETQLELQQAQYARANLPEPVVVNMPQLDQAYEQIKESYSKWVQEAQAAEAHLNAIIGGQCPTCGQHVPHKGDVPAAQNRLAHAKQQAHKDDAVWGQIRKQISDAKAAQDAEAKLSRARADADKRVHQLSNKLAGKQAAWTNVTQETCPYANALAEHATLLNSLEAELADKRAVLENQMEALKYLAFWIDGFGSKGLKSYVLDASLAEMTEEMNRWIQLLTGGTIWVRCETQRQVGKGKKAKLVEDFSIRVFRHNPDGSTTERNYRSWSGGEKDRVGLGVDFGLSRLVAKRAKQSWNVLILDELFRQSIDDSGKDAIGDMVLELSKERETIIVIDHDASVQGLVEKKINVVKKNGRSTFEEPDGKQLSKAKPKGDCQGEVHSSGAP